VEPLGAFDPLVVPVTGLLLGALGVLTAAALLELSRTLAETYKGRWFAGNGRDVFHVAAVGVLASMACRRRWRAWWRRRWRSFPCS
jgi:hypothetical protein